MATCPVPNARLRALRRVERVRKLRNQNLRRPQQLQAPGIRNPRALRPRRAIPSQQLKARRPPRPNPRLPLRRRQPAPNPKQGPRAPRAFSAVRPRRCRPAALTAASGSRVRPTASSAAWNDGCVARRSLKRHPGMSRDYGSSSSAVKPWGGEPGSPDNALALLPALFFLFPFYPKRRSAPHAAKVASSS